MAFVWLLLSWETPGWGEFNSVRGTDWKDLIKPAQFLDSKVFQGISVIHILYWRSIPQGGPTWQEQYINIWEHFNYKLEMVSHANIRPLPEGGGLFSFVLVLLLQHILWKHILPLREGPSLLLAKVPDRIGRIGIFAIWFGVLGLWAPGPHICNPLFFNWDVLCVPGLGFSHRKDHLLSGTLSYVWMEDL